MRKLTATACLALLLVGCGRMQEEASYEGLTTSQWIEELSNEDVNTRRKAAIVLGELGLTEAEQTVPALANACGDADTLVKIYALQSLERLAPKAKKAQNAVGRAMSDKHKVVLKQAMRTFKAIEMAKPSALNGGA
ncbi:MAG TPA: HEAT repeat domain-containing protein [Gemmataceae bacterium]|nr:HEAT repeat domain-containing protein [Gemmataceae bacterium]